MKGKARVWPKLQVCRARARDTLAPGVWDRWKDMTVRGTGRLHRAALVLPACAVLAACGSTVQLGAQGQLATGATDQFGNPITAPTASGTETSAPLSGVAPTTNASAASGSPASIDADAGGSGASSQVTSTTLAPLKIGATYINNSGSSAALGVSSTPYTAKTAFDALVKGFNGLGGLAGRKLVPVTYSFNGQSASYETQAQAACAKFTQDNHVSVVLDQAFGYTAGFGTCLSNAKVLQITSALEEDRARSNQIPLHSNTFSMTPERAYSAALNELAGTGYLNRSNQLGIILEDCPSTRTAYDKTLVPLIASLGLRKAQLRTVSCTVGFSSAAGAASTISSATLAFNQAGVDRVMFVSDNESVALLFFQNTANSQSYRPGYVLTSGAQPEGLRTSLQKEQRPQLHGVGWEPLNDVTVPERPTAVEQRCLSMAKAGGANPTKPSDKLFVHIECGMFLLLEKALQQTGGVDLPSQLQSAINGVGSTFAAPGLVGNRTTFSPSRHDGPDLVRVFGYDISCSCLRYSGPKLSVP